MPCHSPEVEAFADTYGRDIQAFVDKRGVERGVEPGGVASVGCYGPTQNVHKLAEPKVFFSARCKSALALRVSTYDSACCKSSDCFS